MSGIRNYIIYTYPWDEETGGIIFMHHLVHELNRMGERAFLYQALRPPEKGVLSNFWNKISKRMTTNPLLDTPVARRNDLNESSIVVYPEVTLGNPLKSENTVRWLLYKPGVINPYSFGDNEMFFRAGPMSDLPELTGGAPDLYLWKTNPTYRNQNRGNRKGVCYLIRKGKDKARIIETEAEGAIEIDGLSHEQVNEVFNRCETFYSYDEATMYSQFAAICGCTSVVVPGMFQSREEWVGQHPNGRYGIAYGDSPTELDHARATRHLLLDDLREKEDRSLQTVQNFVRLTRERFWS